MLRFIPLKRNHFCHGWCLSKCSSTYKERAKCSTQLNLIKVAKRQNVFAAEFLNLLWRGHRNLQPWGKTQILACRWWLLIQSLASTFRPTCLQNRSLLCAAALQLVCRAPGLQADGAKGANQRKRLNLTWCKIHKEGRRGLVDMNRWQCVVGFRHIWAMWRWRFSLLSVMSLYRIYHLP